MNAIRVLFILLTLSAGSWAQEPTTRPTTRPQSPYFAIEVVDAETGRGVPLVELRTTNQLRFYTDSNGLIAFHEPGLMDQEVHFTITSHGYEYPADGFGYRGVRLTPTAGGSGTIELPRKNIAERLYRITGQGIYRDTVLLGREAPIEAPVINGKVMGQDSVQSIVYNDKLYWFWGDTGKPGYPLGQFEMSGATSELPENGGLDPGKGVNLDYFVGEDGFSRPMAPLPEEGVVWADSLVILPDETGRDRLWCHYTRLLGLTEPRERGLMRFNDETQTFERVKTFDVEEALAPRGHAFRAEREGGSYLYFPVPYPNVRVKADRLSFLDLSAYEAFTPLAPGTRWQGPADTELERDDEGKLVWGWKRGTDPLDPGQQQELVEAGRMKREESPLRLSDAETGEPVRLHGSSVAWNDYRDAWILIGVEIGGTSVLGEVWYAEAPSPEGPWGPARKIVTHDRYSFYNPRHHPMLDQDGGRIIYFEGTYTEMFSGNGNPTPGYDYNQIMYRLDLSDERLREVDGQ